jgi:hypothetical protein
MARKKKVKPPKRLSLEYHARRIADLDYYMHRTGLNAYQIAESLGIPRVWIAKAQGGAFQRPCDERISVIIAFLKDFERLQSYYRVLGNRVMKSAKRFK